MENNNYKQFGEWLQQQPYWLQDATWYLYNKMPIDDKKISEYVQMCVRQVHKKTCSFEKMSYTDVLPSNEKVQISIKSVSEISNVNALAENTRLEFGEKGVSVIYGLNGAGKSGFMRIFKHISRHQYAEAIQHNVYKKTSNGRASCMLNVCVDGVDESIHCDLESDTTDDRLCQCDVFDTRISSAYVSNSNSVSYEPFVFGVLKELAVIAGRIEYAIRERTKNVSSEAIPVPDFIKLLEEAKWLEEISAMTIVPEECRNWSIDDEKRADELKNLLDTGKVESELTGLKNQKAQIQRVLSDLQCINNRLVGRNKTELTELHTKYVDAKTQYELAKALFSENASEQDKISISIESWRRLWEAGRRYYESCIYEKVGIPFAKSGSICPLCLQKIDDDFLKRFSSVDDYINGNCSELFSNAQSLFMKKLQETLLHDYSSKVVSTMLEGIVEEETLREILKVYSTIEIWQTADDKEELYKSIIELPSIPVVKKVENILVSIDAKESTLLDSLNIEKNAEMQAELKHLHYRKWVYDHLGLILSMIENANKKKELESALSYVKTNRITSEANKLANALITEAYIERFTSELKRLAPYLKVKLEKGQSVKGKSPYKVVLDTNDKARKSPQDILSEGEQRIVALAAFFADATGRSECTPIIIDDPISSLDYNYEEAATKRITELAKERQVIVFTHRISLLVGLSEQSEKEGVGFSERHIRGTLLGKGVSDFDETYHGKIKDQLNGIKVRIRETQKMDPYSHEYIDSCSRISQQLRICVERSVEDILFQQMVKRFSRRIMTGKLLKMDRISKEDCKIIDSMMTKYSFGEHSQPEDSGLISMDLDEVIEDIDIFLRWIKDYTKKIEAK